MSNPGSHHFHHRQNDNGTHDSICLMCYLTVATACEESHLAPHENMHVCDSLRAWQVSEYGRHAIAGLHSPNSDRTASPQLVENSA